MTILNTVAQSAALSMFSNILAQLIDSYQKNAPLADIDFVPVIQFAVYAILNTPINVAWQSWLESTFPSTKPANPDAKNKSPAENGAKKEQTLDVKNTAAKFLIDQTVGAAFNIPLFIGIIGMLKGQNIAQIVDKIQNDSLKIYFSGMKLWPPVSLISFAFIPAERRVIFGSLAGVIWTIYLSLMAR